MDTLLLEALYSLRNPAWVSVFLALTVMGSTFVVVTISTALGLTLLARKHFSYLAGLVVSVVGTALAVHSLKEIIGRTRPLEMYQVYLENGFAFPSGHAAFSLALYGFIAYLAWHHAGRLRVRILACLLALIVLIGFSRLYLGFHYVSDVLGGYVVGSIFLALGIWVSARLRRPGPSGRSIWS